METTQATLSITWIDAVLDYLAAPTEDPPNDNDAYTNYIEDKVVWQHLSLMHPEMKAQAFKSIAPRILEKLLKDGYVNHKDIVYEGSVKHGYAATFEGVLFSQSKGYRGQLDAINAAAVHQATEDQRNKYLLLITFSIGVSTAVAAVYYTFGLFEFCIKYYWDWGLFFYFSIGVLVGLLIWLTTSTLRKVLRKPKMETT